MEKIIETITEEYNAKDRIEIIKNILQKLVEELADDLYYYGSSNQDVRLLNKLTTCEMTIDEILKEL